MMISPPAPVPGEALRPALSAIALLPVLVVVMDSSMVRLPDWVEIETVPLAVMPIGLTDPMVSAPAFT